MFSRFFPISQKREEIAFLGRFKVKQKARTSVPTSVTLRCPCKGSRLPAHPFKGRESRWSQTHGQGTLRDSGNVEMQFK